MKEPTSWKLPLSCSQEKTQKQQEEVTQNNVKQEENTINVFQASTQIRQLQNSTCETYSSDGFACRLFQCRWSRKYGCTPMSSPTPLPKATLIAKPEPKSGSSVMLGSMVSLVPSSEP
eukprot:15085299-Ditylum_brightwellii.AAC.1